MNQQKIQIDSNGFLQLERKGRLKPVYCPVASPNMTIRCGDWCPFFVEPEMSGQQTGTLLLACQSKIGYQGIILDERETKEAE